MQFSNKYIFLNDKLFIVHFDIIRAIRNAILKIGKIKEIIIYCYACYNKNLCSFSCVYFSWLWLFLRKYTHTCGYLCLTTHTPSISIWQWWNVCVCVCAPNVLADMKTCQVLLSCDSSCCCSLNIKQVENDWVDIQSRCLTPHYTWVDS